MRENKTAVKIWLLTGILMVFLQIVIGGVTRLTGSGLSITKWEIVTGTLPPLSSKKWTEAFDLYKSTPQYQKINQGMSLSEFKFIYFWEYIHRFWARLIGLVFIIPLIFFLAKKWISKSLLQSLLLLCLLGFVVAIFGWIMVKSGLVDHPWVSAYKLAIHLILALFVYSYLLNIYLKYIGREKRAKNGLLLRSINVFILFLFIQIVFGAFMSGMHAGLNYPTWPKIGSHWLPPDLFDIDLYKVNDYWNYAIHPHIKLVVQFIHRSLAYILFLFGFFIYYNTVKSVNINIVRIDGLLLIIMLIIQVALGIITVLSCIGKIPVMLGSLHQMAAILLLTVAWMYRRLLLT